MATRKDLQHELAQFDLDKRQLQLEERKLQLEEQKLQLERKVLDTKRRLLSLNTVDLTDPETQVKSESRESSSQIDQKSFAAGLDAAHATEGSSFIPGNSSRHSTQESSKTVEASENVKEVTVASEKIVDSEFINIVYDGSLLTFYRASLYRFRQTSYANEFSSIKSQFTFYSHRRPRSLRDSPETPQISADSCTGCRQEYEFSYLNHSRKRIKFEGLGGDKVQALSKKPRQHNQTQTNHSTKTFQSLKYLFKR